MKERKKIIALALILGLLILGYLWGNIQTNGYSFSELPEKINEKTTSLEDKKIKIDKADIQSIIGDASGRTNYRNVEMLVDEEFTSNLPLIVIDTYSEEPKRGIVWDSEKGYYVTTGEDPYVKGIIKIINNKKGSNMLCDEVSTESFCKIKVRGNSSSNYDKKQYLIKLLDEEDKNVKKNLLEIGKESEWILNVSFVDKSLLRNFLAYSIAKEIMPYTPDVKFCEVVWKNGNQFSYKGVYLLMESVKVGENRVDLPKGYDNSENVPALMRRDRYNDSGIMVDNYATQKKLTPGYLEIKYPDKDKITEKQIANITNQIDRFEKVLYSSSWEEFVQYREYIDIDSFVDYFIINEYLLNYDAGYNSTYFYMKYDGKISMGPVWDFDQSIDNANDCVADLYTTAFHSAPWFDKMLQDPVFVKKIIDRYAELRKSILSDKSIENYLKETNSYLGEAIERDWDRWGYYYANANYLEIENGLQVNRNMRTYEMEVDKIIKTLSEHSAWLDSNLDSLYQFKMISLEDAEYEEKKEIQERLEEYREAMAIVFVVILLISVHLVTRYENE